MNVYLNEFVRDNGECVPVCSVSLLTEDMAEIRLYLWRFSDGCVVEEAQRRGGDAVTSHKCIRSVHDAAGCNFDAKEYKVRENMEKSYANIKRGLEIIEEAECRSPVSDVTFNARRASLEAPKIGADLIGKDRIHVRYLGMKIILLLTDSMRSCPESADMASHAILCFGGIDGKNVEGLGGIGVSVFSLVMTGWVDVNKYYYEEEDNNRPIYTFALAALANALEMMQPLSASGVSDLLTECEEMWGCCLLSELLNGLDATGKSPHNSCLLRRSLLML